MENDEMDYGDADADIEQTQSNRSRSRSRSNSKSPSLGRRTPSRSPPPSESHNNRRSRSPRQSRDRNSRSPRRTARRRTPSPDGDRPARRRSRDRHGNIIKPLTSPGGPGGDKFNDNKRNDRDRPPPRSFQRRSPQRDTRRSPPRGGATIYDRPHGPRTGIGYPNANILEIRIVIPAKIAGSVIGRKGDLVQQLREKYDCQIGVPPCDQSIDRIVIMRGSSVRSVIDCTCAIADYPLAKEMQQGLDLNRGFSQIRLLLHNSVCGKIIGKQGCCIREIREKSGSDVHMYNEACPRSTDRVCRLTGRVSEIRDALAMIFKFTGDENTKGKEEDYNADNATGNEGREDYGGWRLDEVKNMGNKTQSDQKYKHQSNSRNGRADLDRYGRPREGAAGSHNPRSTSNNNKRSRSRSPARSPARDYRRASDSKAHNNTFSDFPGNSRNSYPDRSSDNKSSRRYSDGNTHSDSKRKRNDTYDDRNGDRRNGDSGGMSRGKKDTRETRHGKRDFTRNTEDAPAYEGPNSSGPNRSDRKKEHPLTAIDLKNLNDKNRKETSSRRMRELLN